MRYTAPAVFTAANAHADAARTADRPKAARNVWIRSPDPMPRPDTTPARRPWAMLRARIYIVSGPGVSHTRKRPSGKPKDHEFQSSEASSRTNLARPPADLPH